MKAEPGVPGDVSEQKSPSVPDDAVTPERTASGAGAPQPEPPPSAAVPETAAPAAVRRHGLRRWLPGELWTHGDFMKFWFGETISLFGNHVTMMALPLVAALTLGASAREVGFLRTAEYAAFIALPLFAGVWVDRRRRRPIMIVTNAGRAVLIGSVPLLALFDALTMPYLYVVALLTGVLTVFFDVAWLSFLPSLVRREHLVEGNSKLMTSSSAAEVGGPGIGGLMIQWLSAPAALAFDALSYVVSFIMLGLIKKKEPEPPARSNARNVLGEIREGFRAVFGNPNLRALAIEGAMFNAFYQFIAIIFLLYALRVLDWSPGLYGLLFSTAAIGAVLGTATAPALARRFGFGPSLTAAVCFACIAPVLIPMANDSGVMDKAMVVAAMFSIGIGEGIANVLAVTLRQTVTPDRLLGRMNASMRMLLYGGIPFGALLAGILGETVGLRNSLWLSCIGFGLALIPVFRSPIPRLRDVPVAADDGAADALD